MLLGFARRLVEKPRQISLWPTYDSALVIARSNVRAVFVAGINPSGCRKYMCASLIHAALICAPSFQRHCSE
jgi:hypothetical protein